MKCYSIPSPPYELSPNQNPRLMWNFCSGCFFQFRASQRHWDVTSLSSYKEVISFCKSLLLAPPFRKHLIRQTKGRVISKIISCIFTSLLYQQVREAEITALSILVGNRREGYAKNTLVHYFLMSDCLIFTGFISVPSHNLLKLAHASQQ